VFTHAATGSAPLTPDAQPVGNGSDLQLYARDLNAGTTTLVDANVSLFTADRAPLSLTSVSADGRYVAFTCLCQRVWSGPNPGSGRAGVYRTDLTTRDVVEVDVNADGVVVNGVSSASAPRGITADGSSILIGSSGDNLVTGDINSRGDVFVSTPH
jgi:hypothetical protein